MPPKQKVLVLTAGYGEGHNTAARSVAAAVREIAPETAEATVLDLFELCYGRVDKLAKKGYLATINHAPKVWQKIYEALDSTKIIEASMSATGKARRKLAEILETEKPAAVVSTYPVYSFLLRMMYPDPARRPFVFITVVTDSITINSVWHRAPSDYFIVANNETASELRKANVGEPRIKVLGFPITHRFAVWRPARSAPSEQEGRRVLYMINFGKKNAPDLVRRLLDVAGIQLTVTVGRDMELQNAVEKVVAESGKRAHLYGWTDQLPELVMNTHILISKAGGATVQEAIGARTPMIISQIVPGQEEGNARLIVENRCGVHAATNEDIARAVTAAFADDARLWHEWHGNLARLSRPDAALRIAEFALEEAKQRSSQK